MISGILHLIILLGTVGSIHGVRTLFGGRGDCYDMKAFAMVMEMKKYECVNMGGTYNGSPGDFDWTRCHVDLCNMPNEGAIAKDVWGIDTDQISDSTGSSRTYGAFTMVRRYCDNMNGYYHGSPKLDDWTKCHLYLKKMDGSNRENIKSLIFCGIDDCSNQIGVVEFHVRDRECRQSGGTPQSDAGANTWVKCHYDIAISPVIDCTPSDLWAEVQTCWNKNPIIPVQCKYEKTTGIQKGVSKEATNGGSTSVSISAEVGAELKGIFSSSVSTSFTTNFDWEHTSSSSDMWRESKKLTLSTEVPPQGKVTISQVVGKCNDYYVKTSEFRLT